MSTRSHSPRWAVPIALLAVLASPHAAVAGPKVKKKPLDHASYDRWSRISQQSLSNDGKWILYTTRPAKGTSVVRLLEIETQRQYVLQNSRLAQFSFDSRHIVYLTTPKPDSGKTTRKTSKSKTASKATTAKTPAKKTAVKSTPKTSLVIMELATGRRITVVGVKSFVLPKKAGNWIAYLLEKRIQERIEKPGKSTITEIETVRPKTKKKSSKTEKKAAVARTPKKTTEAKPKTTRTTVGTLAVRNLTTGVEARYPHVERYRFAENGKRLAWSAALINRQSAVFVLNTLNRDLLQIARGRKSYRNLVFDKSGNRVAFFVSASASPKSEKSLYCWMAGNKAATLVASAGRNGFAKNRRIAASSTCEFSGNGSRLFFSTVKRPKKKPKSTPKKATGSAKPAQVDIWHWRDPYLQPMQLVRARRERSRSYRAVVHLKTKTTVQLATETVPAVTVGSEKNSNIGIGISNLPYRLESSWDWPGYVDVYLIDVRSGSRRRVLTKAQSRFRLSPGGNHLAWWDGRKKVWMGMDVRTRRITNLTKDFPYPLHDEQHDRPFHAGAYGTGGWLKNDAALLVYDKHDIWAVDPTGKQPAKCLTEEYGRKHNLRFRRLKLNPEERGIDPKGTLLLSAFHLKTKASGFYRDRVEPPQTPKKLLMKDEAIRLIAKARSSDDVLLVRSTFQRYPDLWQSTTDFQTLRRISDANPQQKEYSWGRAQLVAWKAKDGQPLQGILIRPEGFDPKKKYPMLVYFYERMSHRLHYHYSPAPVRASINISFYASRGYLVFLPDITYKIGAPGKSAMNSVIPGVEHLIKKGFVNEKAIGVQGHSWGGYQVAHLVTRTNIFAAAESGAPVSNMTSAYGGIRWSSGMSRMFQYEKTQSRIGATLWKGRGKYLENSPLFHANRIHTPLLILHNDKDGAVPWYQGIELFVAMRRLSKPAWLLNYNGEGHGLSKLQNRKDFSIRMQQFFDHFLKGAPAPVWLSKGVPAVEKGKTTGLDLLKSKRTAQKNKTTAGP